MQIKKVGVIGAGVIGTSIAIDLVLHSFQVVLIDISEAALDKARNEFTKGIRFAPLLNKSLKSIDLEEALGNIMFSMDLNELASCNIIIENTPEVYELKEELYKKLDSICEPDICFGVNTSCVSITKIAGVTKRQDKVIGMHFMNPSYLKQHIEVIKGFNTSEETINHITEFLSAIKKVPIIVNDLPGFVSNRVSHLFMNEAAFVVQDQVATPEKVDMIFKECFGHKMGPLETADLIGLDTVVNSLDILYKSYQDPKFRCCPLLRKMVEANLLGRKSGRGFYNYS
ncbi:MAG: 3-hydroxyacyl-CoA dehydrogenase family protein [Caulobacteraceae bacterium]